METKIETLLKPITDELGVDIIKIKLGGGQNPLLRITVDKVGGVDSDVLERISRGLALQLDVEDPIKSAFRLEVSTPGLDWPLTTVADFERYQGEWLKVLFANDASQEGRNLGPAGEKSFTLLVDGGKRGEDRQLVIEMSDVSKVVRAINWKEVSRAKK
ncbi:MAG: ribosome assembly cofactor RimP [Mariprofundus sp.]